MEKRKLRLIRLGLGLLTGLLLWIIWRCFCVTTPELESIRLRLLLSDAFFGTMFGAVQTIPDGYTRVSDWQGLLPLACFFSVLFAIQKPLTRFISWLFAIVVCASIAIYCFREFHLVVPWGGPMVVLNCFYLCGTLIHLETEKIERNRLLAIDLQGQAEAERKRIAKDLHDESLSSMSKIIRLTDKLDSGESNATEIRSRLETCMNNMRRIINDLHPSVLEEFGLAIAIEDLLAQFRRDTGIKANFRDSTNGSRLTSFDELCVYRIFQESLNNIFKHANATEVELRMDQLGNRIRFKLSDNGNGNVSKKKGSHGLRNIADRAGLLGSKIEWKKPEQFDTGTMLVFYANPAPLQQSKEADSTYATVLRKEPQS